MEKSLSSVQSGEWLISEHSFKNQTTSLPGPGPVTGPNTVTLPPSCLIMQNELLPFSFYRRGQKARKAGNVGVLVKSESI